MPIDGKPPTMSYNDYLTARDAVALIAPTIRPGGDLAFLSPS